MTRVSTEWAFQNQVLQMQRQQADLSRTQEQVSSGERILQPSDDPAAAVRGLELGRALQETEQFEKNTTMAENRLQRQEGSLEEGGKLLQRARELTVQGNNASQDAETREFMAKELRQIRDGMIDLANTQDASDQFIFAGYKSGTRPFSESGEGVEYNGDSGKRELQIGPSRKVTDGNPGNEVFMNIREGNGLFVLRDDEDNEGTGVVKETTIRDSTEWSGEEFTLEIIEEGEEYEIRDVDDDVVQDGDFVSGEAIRFQGTEFVIEGSPEEGDQFSIEPSRNQSVFETLDNLIEAFESRTDNPQEETVQRNAVNRGLDDLDQAIDNFLDIRSETGARLSAIDDQRAVNEGSSLDLEVAQSEIQDLDYAEAVSRLTREQIGLQAAQQTFSQVQGTSLFDFLR